MKTDWFLFSYSHFTVVYRQCGDLIEAFKILNDFTNVQMRTAFTLNATQFTRGHPFKLVKSRCNLELRRHFFTNRLVNQWNSLPSYVACVATNCELL